MTEPATTIERTRGGGCGRIAHAEDPRQPGVALCGTRLAGTPRTAAGQRCAVCLDLARRTFVGR